MTKSLSTRPQNRRKTFHIHCYRLLCISQSWNIYDNFFHLHLHRNRLAVYGLHRSIVEREQGKEAKE